MIYTLYIAGSLLEYTSRPQMFLGFGVEAFLNLLDSIHVLIN